MIKYSLKMAGVILSFFFNAESTKLFILFKVERTYNRTMRVTLHGLRQMP